MKNFYFSARPKKRPATRWLSQFLILVLVFFQLNSLNAQARDYLFSQSNGSYSSLSSGTLLAAATDNLIGLPSLDTSDFPVSLPFGFIFNGQPYTDLKMSTNGYIAFGNAPAVATSPISGLTAWEGTISAWGRDINTVFNISGKTGKMSWGVEGSAPNRVAVMEWENFRPVYAATGLSAYVFSFQVRLSETSNKIEVVYSEGAYLIGNTSYASQAQIGLRGATNADFNNRANTTGVSFTASLAGTVNNSAQSFSTTANPPGMPTNGLTYSWTPPNCLAPFGITATNITPTAVTVQWTPPASPPANGYDIYYSVNNTNPTSSTTPTITGATGSSRNITGLNPSSAYFVWMRSVCSPGEKTSWIAMPSFNTSCAPITEMYESFDSYAIGSIVPNCWGRIISGTGTQTISSSSPASAPHNLYQFSNNASNQTIVVMPVFSNVNAGTHWVRLKAKVTTAPRTLEFGYVTNAADANSFVLLESKSITNTSYDAAEAEYTFMVPASVPANARLAIKNPGTVSTTLYCDNVYWELAPTCFPPANITATATSPTTADISWTASVTPPALGYDVYVSTVNTPPVSSTTPTVTGVMGNITAVTGLTPSVQYFAFVRARCSGVNPSSWSTMKAFNTPCQPPTLLSASVSPNPVCAGGTATLSATADAGTTISWYDAVTGGNLLATGPVYTTPVLAATTNYYASASSGTTAFVGKTTLESNASTGGGLSSYLVFTALSDFTLGTVDLFPFSTTDGTPGTATIALQNAAGFTLMSATVNVTGASLVATSVPQTVTLNFPVAGGQSYRLAVLSWTGITNMYRDATNLAFPYSLPGVVDITGGSLATPYYYFFYNWQVLTGCASPRTMVTAVYDPSCTMGTSETEEKNKISIYPNPFTDVVYISDVKDVVSVTILDAAGRFIKNMKPARELYLGDLKSGMYLMNLRMKNGTVQAVKAIKK